MTPYAYLLLLTIFVAPLALGEDRTIDFANGKWDKTAWTPVRLAPQTEALHFAQREKSLGNDDFTAAQKKTRTDNILLVTDAKQTDGQVELTFKIGPQSGAAPTLMLSPTVKDGRLDSALIVCVANYTMAVWWARFDADSGKMTYKPLVRMNRWSQPGDKHVLRCRVKKVDDRNYDVALQLDDSDTIMLSQRDAPEPLNSNIGIWGCHGQCEFYQVRLLEKGTLPWEARPPSR